MHTRMQAIRPMRSLLNQLPCLPVTDERMVDYTAADPHLFVAIRDDAEMTMRVIHQGLTAIGSLIAHSGVAIEDGSIGADCLESLGYLMAELGDIASGFMVMAAHCRRETQDFKEPFL
ncbi:hypothetical protein [Paucibacter sp. Y2R2-4]|uniref:hypothetical protein n=1 Tax=Paucibacter sp. Y2R2-4 TaxID=2893553 RepID=UPI0021E4144B|nr:hypothetical protein [Paucibacter sp. Y2R2-4]MCV2351987.1 hypothetical protein [Paucibacter sp. Y2R2-4]